MLGGAKDSGIEARFTTESERQSQTLDSLKCSNFQHAKTVVHRGPEPEGLSL